ncbi:MAG: hypothetical protein H0W50_03860 [Parachlamydiaceae bacterium]|nr:hypothetical protein [Parachlamydiaceae bacterium]
MGALSYEPEIKDDIHSFDYEDLDNISYEISQFQDNDNDKFVDDLLVMNGSSAGARPKIVATINGEDVIIKFCSSFDPKDNSTL